MFITSPVWVSAIGCVAHGMTALNCAHARFMTHRYESLTPPATASRFMVRVMGSLLVGSIESAPHSEWPAGQGGSRGHA